LIRDWDVEELVEKHEWVVLAHNVDVANIATLDSEADNDLNVDNVMRAHCVYAHASRESILCTLLILA
jgi:hypothetical protein